MYHLSFKAFTSFWYIVGFCTLSKEELGIGRVKEVFLVVQIVDYVRLLYILSIACISGW